MARKRSSRRRGGRSSSFVNNKNVSRGDATFGPIYRFLRVDRPGDISKGATDQGYQQNFIVSALPGSTDFSNLFDQYRIDKIELSFILDLADGALNTTTLYPRLVIAPDWNDSTAPSTEDDVLQYQQAKVFQFNAVDREFVMVIKPKVASTVFRTAVTSAYQMIPAGFIDTGYLDVPHYGVKFFLNNYNTTSFGATVIRQYVRYHLSLANPR